MDKEIKREIDLIYTKNNIAVIIFGIFIITSFYYISELQTELKQQRELLISQQKLLMKYNE